ncbi:MAG: hypothetical protein JWO06_2821 [Bacteroidota bacterium]|nr:hypothetical protein [Bacteroidota bacterium]
MKTDRVVLDSNIFISLILNRRLDKLVEWSKDENVDIITCPELFAELKDVLGRNRIKKNLTNPVSAYINFIKDVSKEVTIDLRFDRAPDVKDNYLFDLAYTAKAHYIVSGDHPLLNMKQVNKIRIISLSDWQKLLDK